MEVPENFRPCACSSWSPNRTPRSSTGGNVPRRCWPLRLSMHVGRWKKLGWAWNDLLGGGILKICYIFSPQFPGKKMTQFDDCTYFWKIRWWFNRPPSSLRLIGSVPDNCGQNGGSFFLECRNVLGIFLGILAHRNWEVVMKPKYYAEKVIGHPLLISWEYDDWCLLECESSFIDQNHPAQKKGLSLFWGFVWPIWLSDDPLVVQCGGFCGQRLGLGFQDFFSTGRVVFEDRNMKMFNRKASWVKGSVPFLWESYHKEHQVRKCFKDDQQTIFLQ